MGSIPIHFRFFAGRVGCRRTVSFGYRGDLYLPLGLQVSTSEVNGRVPMRFLLLRVYKPSVPRRLATFNRIFKRAYLLTSLTSRSNSTESSLHFFGDANLALGNWLGVFPLQMKVSFPHSDVILVFLCQSCLCFGLAELPVVCAG